MFVFIVRRVAQSVPLLFGISIAVFLLLQITPGGPLSPGASGTAAQISPEQMARMRAEYGLDEPLPTQYIHWVGGLLTGDWGTSIHTGRPVLALILERLPTTLTLMALAWTISVVIAILVGVTAATRQHSVFDYVSSGLSFVGFAIPSFWMGLMLLYVFTYSLGWLPGSGLEDLRASHSGLSLVWDRALHLVMPVSVLGLICAAELTRFVRGSMLEVLGEDYIRTARGSGLPERAVLLRHALKNAAIPVVTIAILEIPWLFLGSAIVEVVFSLSGMGRLFIESANQRDYPVLLGVLVLASVLVVVANIVADALYGALDPRIVYD